MKNLTEEKYSLEEYVFFKMKGYPWWPGYITDIQNLNKKKIYYIVDSFTNTVSKISDNKNIEKFEENIENVTSNAKGKKYINSLVNSIISYFQGKKMPKKFEIIIKELKEGKNTDKNKENINNKEERKEIKKNKEEKINKKEKDIEKEKEENKISTKNNYLLNKKRKLIINNNEKNIKKENKIKKTENKVDTKETKEIKKKKESPKKDEELDKKKKKVKLEGLEKIKEEIKEKERREEEKKKEMKEKENEKKEEKKEKKDPQKESLNEENEEITESVSSSTSENKEKNIMIKSYKNFDFYQIVKYLKRIAEYLDKNQKEGRNSYFSIEDKKNFIKVMEYLNSKEIDDPKLILKTTNIGNYINYINEKTKIKEFKELTNKFLEINRQKIQLQLFLENALNMNETNL